MAKVDFFDTERTNWSKIGHASIGAWPSVISHGPWHNSNNFSNQNSAEHIIFLGFKTRGPDSEDQQSWAPGARNWKLKVNLAWNPWIVERNCFSFFFLNLSWNSLKYGYFPLFLCFTAIVFYRYKLFFFFSLFSYLNWKFESRLSSRLSHNLFCFTSQ